MSNEEPLDSAMLYDKEVSLNPLLQEGVYARAIEISSIHQYESPVVVDINCGTGRFMMKLKEKKPDAWVIGIDASWNMLLQSMTNFREAGYKFWFPGQWKLPTHKKLIENLKRNDFVLINTYNQRTGLASNLADLVCEIFSGGDLVASLDDGLLPSDKEYCETVAIKGRLLETIRILKIGSYFIHSCLDAKAFPGKENIINNQKQLLPYGLELVFYEEKEANSLDSTRILERVGRKMESSNMPVFHTFRLKKIAHTSKLEEEASKLRDEYSKIISKMTTYGHKKQSVEYTYPAPNI